MSIGTPTPFVYSNGGGSGVTSGSAVTLNAASVPAGALIVLYVGCFSVTDVAVSTALDSAGNNYHKDVQSTPTAGLYTNAIFSCPNCKALTNGSSTITCTVASGTYAVVGVYVTGANGGLDKSNQATSTTSVETLSAATGTLSVASEFIFAGINLNSPATTFTESSAFTQIEASQNWPMTGGWGIDVATDVTSATTSVAYAPSWTPAQGCNSVIASYMASVPITNLDWPLPIPPPNPPPPTITASYNPNLVGQDYFPPGRLANMADWPLPRAPAEPASRTITANYNWNLLGEDAFTVGRQSDWPNPPPVVWYRSIEVNLLQSTLSTPPAPLPFNVYYWPLPIPPPNPPPPTITASYNPNLVGQDYFPPGRLANMADWPLPQQFTVLPIFMPSPLPPLPPPTVTLRLRTVMGTGL